MSDFTFPWGNGRSFTSTVNNLPSTGLQGYVVIFTGKKTLADPDSAALWEKRSPHTDLTIVNGTNTATVTMLVHAADTDSLPADAQTDLEWDLTVIPTNGDPYTVDAGVMRVTPHATQAVS